MIAAIYARKSTDQTVADEAKSVTRQIESARAYAAKQGWTVAEEHVYSDDGISGAEFLKRPDYPPDDARAPRYRGEVVWNRQQARPLGRERTWTGLEAVASCASARTADRAEDLWQAAHRRLDADRQLYGGRMADRPDHQQYLGRRSSSPRRAMHAHPDESTRCRRDRE
jgi:hypothetical protein